MQTEDFLTYSVPRLIGQVADTSLQQIDSYVAADTIAFGAPVIRVLDKEKYIKHLDLLTEPGSFLGIAVRNEMQTSGEYLENDMVSVLTFGRVVVTVNASVEAGDKAYLHDGGIINGDGTSGIQIGTFINTQLIPNELVILEIGKK